MSRHDATRPSLGTTPQRPVAPRGSAGGHMFPRKQAKRPYEAFQALTALGVSLEVAAAMIKAHPRATVHG